MGYNPCTREGEMELRRHYHAIAIVISLWLIFVVHSCTRGRPVKEEARVGDVTAAPSIQIGLGRCLRDTAVRIAVRGPYVIRGAGAVLGKGDALDWTEVKAGEGLQVGAQIFRENPIAIVPAQDGTLEV